MTRISSARAMAERECAVLRIENERLRKELSYEKEACLEAVSGVMRDEIVDSQRKHLQEQAEYAEALEARLASPTLVELGELDEWLERPRDYFLRIHKATRDALGGLLCQATLKEWNDELEEVIIAWGDGDTLRAAVDALGEKLKKEKPCSKAT